MTTLAEELHILALNDKGAISTMADLNTGSVGAILLELVLAERIDLKDKKVIVTDPTPTGHPVIDAVLEKLKDDKPRSPQTWVSKIGWGQSKTVLEAMISGGVVDSAKKKMLGLFPSTRYVPRNPRLPEEIRGRLAAAAAAGHASEGRTAALAALLRALYMDKQGLPDMSSTQARKALKPVADTSWASDATRQAVQATQTAMIVAMSAAITTSTTTVVTNG